MRVTIHLDLIQPVLNMRKSFLPRYIIHQKRTNSTPVIRPRNGPEILLPRSIPYLQLNGLILHRNGLGPELNSDRYIMGSTCLALYKLKHNTGLTNSSVTNDNKLEQVVVGVHYYLGGLMMGLLVG